MKYLLTILVIISTTVVQANRGRRGTEEASGRKGNESFASRMIENNTFFNSVFGRTYEFKAVERANSGVQRDFWEKMTSMREALQEVSRKEEFKNDPNRKQQLASIMEGIETAYIVRAKIETLQSKMREGEVAKEKAQELIDLIDNSLTILEAKIRDPLEGAEMSFLQIMRTLEVLNRANLKTAQDIITLNDTITAIIGPIRRASRCRAV